VVSSKSKVDHPFSSDNELPTATTSLGACLVDGDAAQLARDRRLRRRALLISVIAQIIALAALILFPILSKTERIALANVMPMPPYYRATSIDHTPPQPHHLPPKHGFTFCLTCPPKVAHNPAPSHDATPPGASDAIGVDTGAANPECPECAGLVANNTSQPPVPHVQAPSILHLTHLDPAMLIHRVEPVFPTLARQTGREGRVELHAIISTDGSVISLQVMEGDAMFYQSALGAVRQWRYKPTFLNGNPVEVDTRITVIYKLSR
jgi:periplasmic protein TonB